MKNFILKITCLFIFTALLFCSIQFYKGDNDHSNLSLSSLKTYAQIYNPEDGEGKDCGDDPGSPCDEQFTKSCSIVWIDPETYDISYIDGSEGWCVGSLIDNCQGEWECNASCSGDDSC